MNFLPDPDGTVTGIRPQHLRLATPATPDAIPAEVTLVEALGTETVLHATTPDGQRLLAVLPGQTTSSAAPPSTSPPTPPTSTASTWRGGGFRTLRIPNRGDARRTRRL